MLRTPPASAAAGMSSSRVKYEKGCVARTRPQGGCYTAIPEEWEGAA